MGCNGDSRKVWQTDGRDEAQTLGDFSPQKACLQLERQPGWFLQVQHLSLFSCLVSYMLCLFLYFFHQVIKMFEALDLDNTMSKPRDNSDDSMDVANHKSLKT